MTLSVKGGVDSDSHHLEHCPKKRVVVMARHGERQDYVDKAAGKNWIPTTNKPWDPPLSDTGKEQSRKMGQAIHTMIETHGLPPLTNVYSSQLIRCRQTAAAAITSIKDNHTLKV